MIYRHHSSLLGLLVGDETVLFIFRSYLIEAS